MRKTALLAGVVGFVAVGASSCSTEERKPTTTFYERQIAPILGQSCATSPSGSQCHVVADDRGNALGNLSVENYDTLILRRDLLLEYGPYGMPNLLLKSVPPFTMRLTSWDNEIQLVTTDVPHAGGSLFDRSSPSFTQLLRWIDRGATENNTERPETNYELTPCSTRLGQDPLFDADNDPSSGDYGRFRDSVNPILVESCVAGNCHGASANSLYLTCGETDEQVRWNYFAASDYVSVDPAASEILRRSLSPSQGGTFHEGGTLFPTPSDSRYQAVLAWAEEKGGPTNVPTDAGFELFAKRVQPMLAKKGCMIVGCHSPSMFHDYRLRGGSGGHFGLPATRKNYELTLEQVALEGPINASRLMRKNLIPGSGGGMLHRGGPLLATPGDVSQCDLEEARTGDLDQQSPYCVLAAWIETERQERMATSAPLSSIVYVKRSTLPSGKNRLQDYADYSPGSTLARMGASMDLVTGDVTTDGAEESLMGLCGLDSTTADVRRPAVSWDGTRIAFSARTGEGEPLRIYVIDGDSCEVEPTIDAAAVDDDGNSVPTNGELVHNFDPAFAPDGRIVFASTRGNTKNVGAFSYEGPQRTPADPSKLNANLYIAENGSVRQLTFLLNQEVGPAFMADGRAIFTAEKRVPGFYQLAGRRINLDGGDYHPLFGQRPTIGHNQFTDVVELTDKNLAAIVSERGAAHGAGRLVVVNRSIGIDQRSDDPADYVQDESAISYPNYDFYQRSISIPDTRATGRLDSTQGAYRNPSPLPNGHIVVSHAPDVSNLADFNGNFDIVVVNSSSGGRSTLIQDADNLLWPVAVYARQNHGVFESRADEANGSTFVVTSGDAASRSEITFMDIPLLTSLIFQNTRTGRIFDPRPAANGLQIWESLPPEGGVTSFDQGGGFVTEDEFGRVYARRRFLGGITPLDDGSGRVRYPGGLPIVLAFDIQLEGDPEPRFHYQKEEMQFYPGEVSRQSFRREFFNNLCGGCHGSVNGLETHVAADPDILTQASEVQALDAAPVELSASGSIEGPPFD